MPRFGKPIRRIGPPLFPGRRRPFGPPRPLPPGPIKALAQANRLLAEGQYAPAAERFEMLANAARANNLPFAPRLFLQAARANWHAGQVPHGMQLLRNGLGILVTAGAVRAVRQISSAAVSELEQLGLAQEAEEVKKFLSGIPTGMESPADAGTDAGAASPAEEARPTLPTHCDQCGAIIRSDEVEWIDKQTAECAYCGSPIRPEKN
jgi:hypothetical protein